MDSTFQRAVRRLKECTVSEQDAFLKEILANPADREVRLVFADWLEENGDPRGELIRLQIQLEEMKPGDRGYGTVRKKERALLKKHRLFGQLPSRVGEWEFRAGFIEKIELTLTAFRLKAAEIFEENPVQHVVLKAKSAKLDDVAQRPELAKLTSLELRSNHLGNSGLRTLLESPYLTNLKSLTVFSNQITNEGVARLTTNPNLSGLTELKIAWNHLNDKATEQIVESPTLGEITSLRLDGNFTDHTLRLIAGTSRFRNLTSLTINSFVEHYDDEDLDVADSYVLEPQHQTAFSAAGIRALGTSHCDTPLEELTFRRNLQPGFARALESSPRLASLKQLNCSMSVVQDDDLVLIVRYLRQLEEVHLESNVISDRGAFALAESPSLSNLRKVYLTANEIRLNGVRALIDSPHREKKTKFYLRSNPLSQSEIDSIKDVAGKSFGNFGKPDPWGRWR
jgi:uncharacterized protein (TIGR02996 family)